LKKLKTTKSESTQIYNYTVIFEKEKEGGYHAFCPILKGCHSQGDNFEEAVENITEAIALYLESLKEDNLPIPEEDLVFKSVQITG
jgi:predicted RNase H-like HicB family nuclease